MNIASHVIQQIAPRTPVIARTKRRIDAEPTPGEVDSSKKTRKVDGRTMDYERSMVLINSNGKIEETIYSACEQISISIQAGHTMSNLLSLELGGSLTVHNSLELYLPNRSDSSSSSSSSSKSENSSYSSDTESDTDSISSETSNPQIDGFFGKMEGF
jgi:hypothetical protein